MHHAIYDRRNFGHSPRSGYPFLAPWIALISFLTLVQLGWGAVPEPKYGTRSPAIGTFDGWTAWVGWEAGFSETYEPLKEKYAWVVYFAPEAIYVTLQGSMAVYSGVDVNLGYKYFYGFLKSPAADKTLSTNYLASLWSVSISRESIGLFEGAGPMSHLSMGLEVEAGFFRVQNTKTILPGLQLGAGFSIAYSLLPINLPICVELDREWIPNADRGKDPSVNGFYPIAIWRRSVVAGQNPAQQIQAGLEDLANSTTFPGTTFVMAGLLAPMMQKLAADPDLQAFFADPQGGSSSYSRSMGLVETWLVSQDPNQVPASVVPSDEKKVAEVIKPVLVGSQLAFQTGYRVGAQSNPNNKMIYVDGVITNYCYVGEPCRIEVKASELSDVISNTVPANFQRAWIGFSLPQEYSLSYDTIGDWQWVQMTNGVAHLTINESFSTPQLVRVLYSDTDSGYWNGGHNVELKSRLLIFLDPTDTNGNKIPDFWEQQYGLTQTAIGTDTDGDGFTDYEEFVASTDPTKANDFPRLQFSTGLMASKKVTIPFTVSARRYTVECNTNATLAPDQWMVVEDFYGEDASSDVDLSSYLKAKTGAFRLKIRRF